MANTNTHMHTHTHTDLEKTQHTAIVSKHDTEMSTFAQKIVETFHRKAKARFETSFDTKLAQPPQLPTVGNWIRCIAKVKTSEKKIHYRIDCRAPTEGAADHSC